MSPTSQVPSELMIRTTRFAKENVVKSWWVTGSAWVLLVASIIFVVSVPSLFLKLAGSLLVVAMMTRTFVIYHDYVHRAILKNNKVAEFFFRLYGLFCLAPMTVWRRTHEFHHRYNGRISKPSIGSFPVFTRERLEAASDQEQRDYLRERHPATIALGYWYTFLYGMCIQPFLADPRKHGEALWAIVLHITYISLFGWKFGVINVLFAILVPNLLTFAFGSYLFYVQHNFPKVQYATDGQWAFEISALQSSSFIEMSPWMHWVTGNIGYHHIHHLNSRIPFYRLPEAMSSLPALQNPLSTNFSFKEIQRCLKLKVWDGVEGRMVGWPIHSFGTTTGTTSAGAD